EKSSGQLVSARTGRLPPKAVSTSPLVASLVDETPAKSPRSATTPKKALPAWIWGVGGAAVATAVVFAGLWIAGVFDGTTKARPGDELAKSAAQPPAP